MLQWVSYPLKNVILGTVRAWRVRWLGPWLTRMAFAWQERKREMQPLKIRWGWALLLAIVLVLAMGEWGPAALAVARLP